MDVKITRERLIIALDQFLSLDPSPEWVADALIRHGWVILDDKPSEDQGTHEK